MAGKSEQAREQIINVKEFNITKETLEKETKKIKIKIGLHLE